MKQIRTGALVWEVSNDGLTMELKTGVRVVINSAQTREAPAMQAEALKKTLNVACAAAGIWPQARIVELEAQVQEWRRKYDEQVDRHGYQPTPQPAPTAAEESVQAIEMQRDESCSKCGVMPVRYSELTRYCKACAPTAAEDALREAYAIGALAMAHYYHGDHAGDEFKGDHAGRAMRPEHIEWAKANAHQLPAALRAKPEAGGGAS